MAFALHLHASKGATRNAQEAILRDVTACWPRAGVSAFAQNTRDRAPQSVLLQTRGLGTAIYLLANRNVAHLRPHCGSAGVLPLYALMTPRKVCARLYGVLLFALHEQGTALRNTRP